MRTGSALAWSRTNRLAFISYGDRELGDRRRRSGSRAARHRVASVHLLPARTLRGGNSITCSRNGLLTAEARSCRSELDGPKDVLVADTKTWAVRRVFRAVHFKDHPGACGAGQPLARDRDRDGIDPGIRCTPRRCRYGTGCRTQGLLRVRSRCRLEPRRFGPDGREVAYATRTGIARARTDLSAATSVLETSTPLELQLWTTDGLIAIDRSGDGAADGSGHAAVVINPVTGTTTRTLYTSPRGWLLSSIAVATG